MSEVSAPSMLSIGDRNSPDRGISSHQSTGWRNCRPALAASAHRPTHISRTFMDQRPLLACRERPHRSPAPIPHSRRLPADNGGTDFPPMLTTYFFLITGLIPLAALPVGWRPRGNRGVTPSSQQQQRDVVPLLPHFSSQQVAEMPLAVLSSSVSRRSPYSDSKTSSDNSGVTNAAFLQAQRLGAAALDAALERDSRTSSCCRHSSGGLQARTCHPAPSPRPPCSHPEAGGCSGRDRRGLDIFCLWGYPQASVKTPPSARMLFDTTTDSLRIILHDRGAQSAGTLTLPPAAHGGAHRPPCRGSGRHLRTGASATDTAAPTAALSLRDQKAWPKP